uniref:Uncharacterized protein n=1 Tax=viral metagenome TaxID=1070528 RepID=A0A6C0C2T5_9ZZZZ
MQSEISNQNPEPNPEMSVSSYSVNVCSFEKLVEHELSSYLKHLNSLGLLSVSLKECRNAVSSGIPVVKSSKSCGRPKKEKRVVRDSDIIADLTAQATSAVPKKNASMTAEEKAEKKRIAAAKKSEKAEAKKAAKLAKLKTKEEEKAKKALLKAKLAEEKKEKKRLEKEQKDLAKADKLAAKEKLKAEKNAKSKAELERKSKEAKALKKQFNLKDMPVPEELTEEPILNDEGETIGSKVSSFNLPQEKTMIEESIKEVPDEELPEGLEHFKHKSRPNEILYKDTTNDIFVKNMETSELEHIAHYDKESDSLLPLSEFDSDEELSELSGDESD